MQNKTGGVTFIIGICGSEFDMLSNRPDNLRKPALLDSGNENLLCSLAKLIFCR